MISWRDPLLRRRLQAVLLSSGLLLGVGLTSSLAQVSTALTPDGTLGTTVTQSGTLHTITGGIRPGNGPNLFHSFDRFSVGTGATASFTSTQTGIKHILSRVTGGHRSDIDGQVRTDGQLRTEGAQLYLLNPSGVMFGPNASLDVSGSFHVSTADYLRLVDGAKFFAHLAQTSVLSVAPPESFGFLGPTLAPISMQGSTLQVLPGQTLAVISGDVAIVGGALVAPSGRIHLASVASPGEVRFSPSEQALELQVDSGVRLGRLEFSRGALVTVNSTGRQNAGEIVVRAGRLTLTGGAEISSSTQGEGQGGNITVMASEAVVIAGREQDTKPSGLFSSAQGRGPGGNITVQAPSVELTNGATISAESTGLGNAGNVTLTLGGTFVSTKGSIVTRAEQADGGNIQITAPTLVRLRDSTITAEVGGRATVVGGNITIDSQSVVLQNSQIVANAFQGRGGNVRIVARIVLLAAEFESLVSASSTLGIDNPVAGVSGAIASLPQEFAPAVELLRDRCAGRLREGRVSRFVLGGRDGVPLEPGSLLLSPLERVGQEGRIHEGERGSPPPEAQPGGIASAQAHTRGGWEVECARWVDKPWTPQRRR
jgi:filamentous hemagglutinin family protein